MSQQENSSAYQHTHANQSYRFVQLSDPHLSRIVIQHPLQLMNKRILGYLSWLKKRRRHHQKWVLDACLQAVNRINPDHVVITGDMTHIGLPAEFDQVSAWLNEHFAASNTTVIPGNHDLYVNEKWDQTFAKLSAYMSSDRSVQQAIPALPVFRHSVETCYPIVRIRGPIAFIGLSSIYPAQWGNATGKVHHQQIQQLHKLTQSEHLKDFIKVVLIHHPPLDETVAKRKSLLDSQPLQQWLFEANVHLVLHGHGHRGYARTLQTESGVDIPVIGCPSCSSTEHDNGRQAAFYLFDLRLIDKGLRITQHHYQLCNQSRQFKKIDTITLY